MELSRLVLGRVFTGWVLIISDISVVPAVMTQATHAYLLPDLFLWSHPAIKKLVNSGTYKNGAILRPNCNFYSDELAVLRGLQTASPSQGQAAIQV